MWDEVFKTALISLAGTIVTTIASILLAYAAAAVKKYYELLKVKIQNEQPELYAQIDVVVREAIFAAEQLNLNGILEDKKAFAMDYIQKQLEARGIHGLDVDTIEGKLEAAVFAEFNKGKAQG